MQKTTKSIAVPDAVSDEVTEKALAPLRYELLRTPEELDDHSREWTELLETSPSSPFQSFAWNRAWYAHYADTYDEMLVFRFIRGFSTAAIVPLYRQGRSLRFAADTVGDLQDIIAADAGAAREALSEVMRWARRQGAHLQLLQVAEQSRIHDAAKSMGLFRNRAFRFRRCYSCCLFAELPESGDAYVQQLPRKVRGDMRRHMNKLDKQHPDAEIAIHRAGEAPPNLVDDLADFHAAHFRKEGVSLLSDQRFVDMLDEVAKQPDSGLRLSTLKDDETTMAMDVGFSHNGSYYGFLTTFDPAFRKLSPGTSLLLKRLDWFIQKDGIEKIDFLLGSERYKSQFAKESYDVCAFYLYPWGLTNMIRWINVMARRATKVLAKKALNEAGLYKAARSKYVAFKERRRKDAVPQLQVIEATNDERREHARKVVEERKDDRAARNVA